jgi:hypothetical protein
MQRIQNQPPTKSIKNTQSEDTSLAQRMNNLNKFPPLNYTKDQRDSNVEPERHIGLPAGYPYSYEP